MNEYQKAVDRIANYVLGEARRAATHLAGAIDAPDSKVLADVLDRLQEIRPVGVQLEKDKRAGYWRARLRLFEAETGALEADSDPEMPPDEPGASVIRGLPGVAEWAGELAAHFHHSRSETMTWIDAGSVQKRLKSLRPTLSRNQGKATWRIDYQVDNKPWRALIEIQRESV